MGGAIFVSSVLVKSGVGDPLRVMAVEAELSSIPFLSGNGSLSGTHKLHLVGVYHWYSLDQLALLLLKSRVCWGRKKERAT